MAFEDRDVRENADFVKELIGLGSRSTPTTVVESEAGREVIIGFDREKLSRLLGLSASV